LFATDLETKSRIRHVKLECKTSVVARRSRMSGWQRRWQSCTVVGNAACSRMTKSGVVRLCSRRAGALGTG
jgi:hypothetical protein